MDNSSGQKTLETYPLVHSGRRLCGGVELTARYCIRKGGMSRGGAPEAPGACARLPSGACWVDTDAESALRDTPGKEKRQPVAPTSPDRNGDCAAAAREAIPLARSRAATWRPPENQASLRYSSASSSSSRRRGPRSRFSALKTLARSVPGRSFCSLAMVAYSSPRTITR